MNEGKGRSCHPHRQEDQSPQHGNMTDATRKRIHSCGYMYSGHVPGSKKQVRYFGYHAFHAWHALEAVYFESADQRHE